VALALSACSGVVAASRLVISTPIIIFFIAVLLLTVAGWMATRRESYDASPVRTAAETASGLLPSA
jgi:hypothetical protein